ncbi:hypothetical protein BHM03_00030888 [Ensete ventricosum]|nr:hypothetical protein BHM03_00030888 [Ensete ventricosum]
MFPYLTLLTVKSISGGVEGVSSVRSLTHSAGLEFGFYTYHEGSIIRNLLLVDDASGDLVIHSARCRASLLSPYRFYHSAGSRATEAMRPSSIEGSAAKIFDKEGAIDAVVWGCYRDFILTSVIASQDDAELLTPERHHGIALFRHVRSFGPTHVTSVTLADSS